LGRCSQLPELDWIVRSCGTRGTQSSSGFFATSSRKGVACMTPLVRSCMRDSLNKGVACSCGTRGIPSSSGFFATSFRRNSRSQHLSPQYGFRIQGTDGFTGSDAGSGFRGFFAASSRRNARSLLPASCTLNPKPYTLNPTP